MRTARVFFIARRSICDDVDDKVLYNRKAVEFDNLQDLKAAFGAADIYILNPEDKCWDQVIESNLELVCEGARLKVVGQHDLRVVQESDRMTANAKVLVKGPAGQFEGYLLVDSGCNMELNISQHKAIQIGLTNVFHTDSVETHGDAIIGAECRGIAEVFIFLEEAGGSVLAPTSAFLEVMTDLDTNPEDTQPPPAAKASDLEVVLKVSPMKKGKDKFDNDMIIGKPGMWKLGLGIDKMGISVRPSGYSESKLQLDCFASFVPI